MNMSSIRNSSSNLAIQVLTMKWLMFMRIMNLKLLLSCSNSRTNRRKSNKS